jgi:hypothetical protein
MSETPDLKALVEYLSRALVDEPDQVDVQVVQGDRTTVYELRVAESDLGKLIGKNGRTVRAVRTLLSAAAAKMDERPVLEVLE